jgi:hypothetical protein
MAGLLWMERAQPSEAGRALPECECVRVALPEMEMA